jgi:hypothetical protein
MLKPVGWGSIAEAESHKAKVLAWASTCMCAIKRENSVDPNQ